MLAIWIFILLKTPYGSYGQLPPELIRGVGLGKLVLWHEALRATLFSPAVLEMLRWSGVAFCVVALRWPRQPVLSVACVSVLVLDLLTKAIGGYPNHAQFAPLAVLFVLAAFGGAAERKGRSGGPECIALVVAQVVLVLPYTYTGLNRLLVGGADIFRGDALPQYVAYTSQLYSAYGFGIPVGWLRVDWFVALLKVGFAVTTLFEACSPVVLISGIFRLAWLLVMTGFHVSTLLAMNIFFWENRG